MFVPAVYLTAGVVQALLLIGYALAVTLSVPRSVTHPLTWYPAFLAAYAVSFTLYAHQIGMRLDPDVLQTSVFLHALGLFAFALGVGATDEVPDGPIQSLRNLPQILRAAQILLVMTAALAAIGLISIAANEGLLFKRQIIEARSGDFAFRLTDFAKIAALAGLLVSACLHARGRRIFTTAALTLAFLFFVYLVTGERDILLSFVGGLGLLVASTFTTVRWQRISVLAAVVGILVVLPISQAYKTSILRDFEAAAPASSSPFWGEFTSAGRNLYFILEAEPDFQGETFWWDVRRLFSSDLVGTASMSTGRWYGEVFRPQQGLGGGSGTGWGFSLAAEGWMNFRTAGVLTVFLFLGVVTRWVYRLRRRSILHFVGFLGYASIVVYVTRGDLGTLSAMSFKLVLAPLLLVWVMAPLVHSGSSEDVETQHDRPRFAAARS